jgi:hypothetical protein
MSLLRGHVLANLLSGMGRLVTASLPRGERKFFEVRNYHVTVVDCRRWRAPSGPTTFTRTLYKEGAS